VILQAPIGQLVALVYRHRQSRFEIEVPVEELGKRLEQTGQLVGRVYKHRRHRPEVGELVPSR
jgi:hypothetical protein